MCSSSRLVRLARPGLRFITALSRTHLYVLVPSSVQMARGGEEYGETGCKLLIRSATGCGYCALTVSTTSTTILCGQVLRSTQRARTCAPCLLYALNLID